MSCPGPIRRSTRPAGGLPRWPLRRRALHLPTRTRWSSVARVESPPMTRMKSRHRRASASSRPVRYIEVLDDITQIRAAWPEVRGAVGSLRGRKFLVLSTRPAVVSHRVVAQDDAAPDELALPEFVVPEASFCACASVETRRRSTRKSGRPTRGWKPQQRGTTTGRASSRIDVSMSSTYSCQSNPFPNSTTD